MVSIFLARSLMLQTSNINENNNYEKGYYIIEIKDLEEATEEGKEAMEEVDNDD
ncbi:MAG TPA: hypothetical protein VJ697_16905 [Nitrososphaeraceae archaeon]|nr:hypothetical protein [Nitrososphaeraceae archaeon]